MKWPLATALLPAAILALSGLAHAQGTVPSCYAAARLRVTSPAPVRSVFVVIDQTTALDADLRRTVSSNFGRLLQPGTSFTIATFSAFSRGYHTTIAGAGVLEGPVPVGMRRNLPVNRLNALDRCLVRQTQFARRVAGRALAEAMGVPATNFANSEIMMSLAHLSERVHAAPGRRIVIVASDLMEHSSASSFYRNQNLRLIDPPAELRNARVLGLLGNFGRAAVFVVGTGLQPPEAGNSIRNVRELNALTRFWTMWFTGSNAGQVTIGRPNIVVPIE
jgi:hypothetical protein